MTDLLKKLGKEVMIFDGHCAPVIQELGLKTKKTELLNLTNAKDVAKIHKRQIDAGCDFITTNTFGANRIKMAPDTLKPVINNAIESAKYYRTTQYIIMDIGPLGENIYPKGTLSFDDAYQAFQEIVMIARDKVDGFLLDAFTDLYELKCALLAVKENCDKPVFATMAFETAGITLTGTSPRIMATLMSNMGADAVGICCPCISQKLLPIADEVISYSEKPVIILQNFELQRTSGQVTYDIYNNEPDCHIGELCRHGVAAVGGCCHPNQDFIRSISIHKGEKVPQRTVIRKTIVTSATKAVVIDKITVCGERINPSGKKKLKETVITRDFGYLYKEAVKQEKAHADLLDVNLGIADTDEAVNMKKVVIGLNEITTLPLQIDSSNMKAIEAGCRYYNGVPLINSVNGNDSSMATGFEIAKKYGAVVLGLTMDGEGIPKTAEQRLKIAARIVETAEKYGISRHRIIIDTLALACKGEKLPMNETIRALKLVHDNLGVKTALGISNVSFGMSNREFINAKFLAMALANGLSMPILNPCDNMVMEKVLAYNKLYDKANDMSDFMENNPTYNYSENAN